MIAALCTGRLISKPTAGTTTSRKPYTRFTMACDVGGEKDVFVSVFVMDEPSLNVLAKAGKGDSVAAQGNLSPNYYTSKDGTEKHGLSLAFARALTVRQPKRGQI